jgi:hypothetical protein
VVNTAALFLALAVALAPGTAEEARRGGDVPPAPAAGSASPEPSESEIDRELAAAEAATRRILRLLRVEVRALSERIDRLGEKVAELNERLSAPEWVATERVGGREEGRERGDSRAGELDMGELDTGLRGEDALLYKNLIERQRALLSRWRDLGAREAAAGRSETLREGEEGRQGRERSGVRRELRRVLAGILDLRDRGRRHRIAELREDLGRLEEELDRRRSDEVRRRLVEERLEDLLGDSP